VARIGLCEDDPAIRRIVIKSMQLAGHVVVVAHNGGEAVRLLGHDHSLSALILDIGLPDADGRDVCQAMRSNGQLAPVMFLTALGAVADKLSGFSAGADDYLPKPFDPLELVAGSRGPELGHQCAAEKPDSGARVSIWRGQSTLGDVVEGIEDSPADLGGFA
jgi:DNA-binding response OmpR family regulator